MKSYTEIQLKIREAQAILYKKGCKNTAEILHKAVQVLEVEKDMHLWSKKS